MAAADEAGGVMHAKPSGTFVDIDGIREYWQLVIGEGFTEAKVTDLSIEATEERTAIVAVSWRMNQAKGIIHNEI